MQGKIDLQRKGIVLSGQPLMLNSPVISTLNPLACCVTTSTSTSSFNKLKDNSFIPFKNILWVEETSSGKPDELEVTYACPTDHHDITGSTAVKSQNGVFEPPYEDAKRKLRPTSQILTINNLGDELNVSASSNARDHITDMILKHAYPYSKFSQGHDKSFEQQSIFVIINPHSGKGEAVDIYNKQVKPILLSAHCNVVVQHTEYKGHATELARSLNIDDYDTIMCASGDGIPYEVINGFYQREDRARAFSKINIVQTPGGSGNALALSCVGATSASLASIRILKGKPSQCDLMAVSKESSDEVILSFLSQTYGAIAQADIGTEWMRGIGGVRFELGVAYEVFSGKKYPCDLAVKWKCKDNNEVYDHYMKHTKNQEPRRRTSITKAASSSSTGTVISNSSLELRELTEDDFNLKYHSYFQQSKSFDDLPEGWEVYNPTTTHNSRIFYAGKMPYIAGTTNFFPAALPADGAIDLVVFDTRSKLVTTANALLSLDKGTHVWEDCVKHSKVEAFRLIPQASKACYISVDGEWFPYEPFQVEVLRGIMRTILWEGSFTDAGYLDNKVQVC